MTAQRTREGELLGIGAVFADSSAIYCYNSGGRKLVVYTPAGAYWREVPLESIGRGSWVGDDFVVREGIAYFLNSVDKRLELFEIGRGLHQGSIPLRDPLFPSQPLRSHQIANRIFLRDQQIWIGNRHRVAAMGPLSLGRLAKTTAAQNAPDGYRFALLSPSAPLLTARQGELRRGNRSYGAPPVSRVIIPGKRLFLQGERLFVLYADDRGFRIEEAR